MPAQEAIQIARQVLATEGYQSVAVGPTAATFVRDVRPPGITIAAYACAIPTLGLSLFALLIRTQESCTVVTGETARRGTALSLSGVVTTETLQDLEAALRRGGGGQSSATPTPEPAFHQFPTPGRGAPVQPSAGSSPDSAPSGLAARRAESGALRGGLAARRAESGALPGLGGRRNEPSPQQAKGPGPGPRPGDSGALPSEPQRLLGQEPLPPRPPSPPRPQVPARTPTPDALRTPLSTVMPSDLDRPRRVPPPEQDHELTMVRPLPLAVESMGSADSEPGLPHWVVILDDGRTIDVPDFALIGRDPEPAEDDPEAGLVSLIDPEMSVSKTHASFGVDDEGLWFLDRFSTNGTSMRPPGGERVGLEPGVATPVLPGAEVWIGRRHLKIECNE